MFKKIVYCLPKFTKRVKKFCYFLVLFSFSVSLSAQGSVSIEQLLKSDPEVVSVYFDKLIDSSTVYHSERNYKKSLELNIDFLMKAFASENPYFIHQGYRMLGHNYRAMNDTVLARESYEKSERFARLSKNDRAAAIASMDLASIYSTNRKTLPRAFFYHDKSIELFDKIHDSAGLARAHYNTILSAMEIKDYKMAYIHILKARNLNTFEKDSTLSVGLDYYLGEYYAQKGSFEMADKYLEKAIEEAHHAYLTLDLERAYRYYSQSLFKQGRYDEAARAQTMCEMYKQLNNERVKSIETEALSAKFQVVEYRKDVKQAEIQNQLQAEIVKNKGKLNIFLLIVSTCFLIMFVALYFAHRKRKELVRKLKIKNKEYLKAKEHSEKLAKAKSRFFSTVSHELRTPLYGVIGLSTILLEDKTLVKHEEDLKSLKFSADYLLALINDVLQINKIDSNNIEDDQSSFNLRELTRKIALSFEYMRLQNKNRIHIHISEAIPKYIRGNSIRLSQILMNLIGNACKFTEEGDIYLIAEVISSTHLKTSIKFYIKDTGIGIPVDKQSSIFEEFSQVDSMNYNYQGTGLGLPIVKKLLALSNSDIYLESESGKGSMFSFELSYDVIEQVEERKEADILNATTLNGKHILIVEDNRINQTVTKKILEKNNIYCSIAENGEEAIAKAKKGIYDLILMDVNMPLKNGMEATREIRLFDTSVPIVALTAVEVEEMRHKIYDSGMNDIIVKPYDITKFINTIQKNISSKEEPLSLPRTRLRAV
jgi:signal transduction histidine kinase/ActR/RegA family two-component response regulator